MAYTNIISRRLDREVINLGFSGNANLSLKGGTHSFATGYIGAGESLTGAVTNNGANITFTSKLTLADHNGATGYFCNKSGEPAL